MVAYIVGSELTFHTILKVHNSKVFEMSGYKEKFTR